MTVDYAEARALVAERLSPTALAHSERVADEAARLAALYDLDASSARLAGLLHDWHRETPAADLVARAEELGVTVTDIDREVPYLLHGPVAAAELPARIPGLADEVVEAVRAHTYGGDPMSPLAMAVYVADVAEPGRPHEASARVRTLAGTVPLAELFATAYAASMHHLVDNRRLIHPATVATWNETVRRSRA